MTTTPQPDGPGSANRTHLVNALGETTTAAIEGLIDERLEVTFGLNHGQLAELAKQVRELYQEHGDTPEVRAAAAEVHQATQGHNKDLGDQTEETAAADTARTKRASEAVEQAREELEGKASQPQPDEPAPAKESVAPEPDLGRAVAQLRSDVDRLEACQGELMVVSATAYASATVHDNPDARRRVLLAAVGAGLVMFLLYLLFLLGPAEWDWNWAIGLPAIAGAIVGLAVWARMREDGPSATSVAAADAITARWLEQGNLPDEDDYDQRDDDDDDPVVPGMRQQPARGAHATAGASAHS